MPVYGRAQVEGSNVTPGSKLRTVYRRVRTAASRCALRLRRDASLTPFERFKRDGHAELLLRRLPLQPDSVVFDIGGYHGDFTAAIIERYGSTVHVFEPIPIFAEHIRMRFAGDARVVVHECALAATDETRTMRLSEDGTGAFSDGEPVIVTCRAATSLAHIAPGTIDLASINIEGGEYELIPSLAEAGLLSRVQRVYVQFHELGPTSIAEREACRALLASTHTLVWDYDFVWEAWERTPNA